MVTEDCLVLPSIIEISLTFSDFIILTSMNLKDELSRDIQGLSELWIL